MNIYFIAFLIILWKTHASLNRINFDYRYYSCLSPKGHKVVTYAFHPSLQQNSPGVVIHLDSVGQFSLIFATFLAKAKLW